MQSTLPKWNKGDFMYPSQYGQDSNQMINYTAFTATVE